MEGNRKIAISMKSNDGEKISYKGYLKNVYKLDSPKHEQCVAKQGDAAFLPQHMKLTLRSDEVTDYTEVLEMTNVSIAQRLQYIDALVRVINKVEDEKPDFVKNRSGKGDKGGKGRNNDDNDDGDDNDKKEMMERVRVKIMRMK